MIIYGRFQPAGVVLFDIGFFLNNGVADRFKIIDIRRGNFCKMVVAFEIWVLGD